ncbi:MocR-like transcription factor YczR [Rhodococcus sp. YH1]|uniref:MocR-like transcription factor YczR n=1 Tax=Rhodococcus sp. YH1 TaxID=89066 RepID=UPI001386AFA4|nr:Histidinol-phosphate aminotransferase [Rhodococcus sp. YH1]
MVGVRVIGAATLVRELGTCSVEIRARTHGRGATYSKLSEGIRSLVHDGRICLGSALPSERDLAGALSVSRSTVTSAYADLRRNGYLISRQGARSVVALPTGRAEAGSVIFRQVTDAAQNASLDLAHLLPDTPVDSIMQAYSTALTRLPALLNSHGMDRAGLPELRSLVARRYTERGLDTTPEQIMITAGAQHALTLVLSCLSSPGDRILVEHPTHPTALMAMTQSSLQVVPIALDPDDTTFGGWNLPAIHDAARQSGARLAHITPDFNQPTGMCLTREGREQYARIAAESGTTLIVDEVPSELWLEAPPPPPMAVFAEQNGCPSICLGSMSKTFWTGLRIGWIRADPAVVSRLIGYRTGFDLGTSLPDQLAAAELLSAPDTLERRRESLRERRTILLDAVARALPEWRVYPNRGGMTLWAEMPRPVSTRLCTAAFERGVLLVAGPQFGVHAAFERHLRLPYTRSPEEIRSALDIVADAYHSLR